MADAGANPTVGAGANSIRSWISLLRGIVVNVVVVPGKTLAKRFSIHLPSHILLEKGNSDKAMEVQSNENAALLKLLKTKSRTKTELLKVSSARRRARQAALDTLLAEGKVIRIDREYFANEPDGSVEQLIHAEAARLDAYLRSVPELLSRSGKKLRRAMKDNALASVALQRLLDTGHVITEPVAPLQAARLMLSAFSCNSSAIRAARITSRLSSYPIATTIARNGKLTR